MNLKEKRISAAIICLISCCIIYLVLLGISVSADPMSGECGENGSSARWEFSGGVLRVSGNGKIKDSVTMKDWYTGEIINSSKISWEPIISQVREVIIGEGITEIGFNSFCNFYNLEKVTIADTVKVIGHNAFANDYRLREMHLGKGIEELRDNVFYLNCFTELTLPASLKTITGASLNGIGQVKNIYVEIGNPYYASIDGVLVSKDGRKLLKYPECRTGNYDVPDGISIIGDGAFTYSRLASIHFPETLTEIGETAFFGADLLSSLDFPESLRKIGQLAFMNCSNIESVIFREGLQTIGSGAFAYSPKLIKVVLPSTVTDCEGAFRSTTEVDYSRTSLTFVEGTGQLINGITVTVTGKDLYGEAFKCLDLVNSERSRAGMEPLSMEKTLIDSAMQRAHEIAILFSHDRPSGLSCATVNSLLSGENIALRAGNAQEAMNMWMNSSGHRANILLADFRSIGIGCAEIDGVRYWVQCFSFSSGEATAASAHADTVSSRKVAVKKDSRFYRPEFSLGSTSLKPGETTEVITKWQYSRLKGSGLTIISSDPLVAAVSGETVTAKKAGTAVIRVYYKGYEQAAEELKVEVKSPSVPKPAAPKLKSVSNTSSGISIKWSLVEGAARYQVFRKKASGSYQKIAETVNLSYTDRKAVSGETYRYSVKAVAAGSGQLSAYSNSKIFARVTAPVGYVLKKSGTGALKAAWKTNAKASGYQVWYSTDKSFKKNVRKKTLANPRKVSCKLSGLRSSGTYYVRIRAYKKSGTSTWYSSWVTKSCKVA